MNLLFLTLSKINSVEERGIYTDLLREFRDNGHKVTIVSPVERRSGIKTNLKEKENVTILQVKTFNIQKTNVIEKGIGTLVLEYQFLSAIRKYLSSTKFDLVLYSTPPITLAKVVEYIKDRDGAKTYLLLKDIFPQNAVDMQMIREGSFLHKMFLKKEKKLYSISDRIGCMSPANVEFLLQHNKEIAPEKVEINPNSIKPIDCHISGKEKELIKQKYSLPLSKKIFVYGGNLGKPQGLDFLLETIGFSEPIEDVFFLIVGDGTEYLKIKQWFEINKPSNAMLLQFLPKQDYDKLLSACDVGLIFLDKKFTIPNFPSRLLSYLEMKMPILVASDTNTDIGNIVEYAKCGYKIIAGSKIEMQEKIKRVLDEDLDILGINAKKLLINEYTVDKSYNIIMNFFNQDNV